MGEVPDEAHARVDAEAELELRQPPRSPRGVERRGPTPQGRPGPDDPVVGGCEKKNNTKVIS